MSNELSHDLSQIGRKGGRASAKALTKKQRIERAKKSTGRATEGSLVQESRCCATRRRGTGTIYKQPGCTTWTIQYYRNGKRIREATGLANYKAAQQRLTLQLHRINVGEYIERPLNPVTVAELGEALLHDYQRNGHRTSKHSKDRWQKHIQPFFGEMPALNVTRDVLERYRDHRLTEGASNATVNREMGLLKRAFRISKLTRLPLFPRQLAEHNRRSGFIEDSDYVRLSREAPELWLRLFLELAFSYGWRKQELLSLRVRQVNILSGTIYLNAEQSKNGEPREVSMTLTVLELMKQAIGNKGPDDYVLTRENGSRVKDFRKAWRNLCVRVGLGSWVCRVCEKTATAKKCECGSRRLRYRGRIVHDFRRSAARLLRRAGVPQSVIMEIGGWKTDSMFRRYAIVSHADHKAAVEKLEQHRLEISQQGKAENSHDFSHDLASTAQVEVESPKAGVN